VGLLSEDVLEVSLFYRESDVTCFFWLTSNRSFLLHLHFLHLLRHSRLSLCSLRLSLLTQVLPLVSWIIEKRGHLNAEVGLIVDLSTGGELVVNRL